MRHRRPATISAAVAALAACVALASPAAAHNLPTMSASPPPMVNGDPLPDTRPEWRSSHPLGQPHYPNPANAQGFDHAAYERAREDWLAVCRHDQRRDGVGGGAGGGLLGGLLGGFLGNRIAGRGDRVLGTVVGGVAGAAAGVAIDRRIHRDRGRDYCEAYLNAYSYGGHGQQGYAIHAMPMMLVPAVVQAQQAEQQPCTETVVTEEWVTEPTRPTTIIRRIPPRSVPDKRIRLAPDKRIRGS